MPRGDKSAYSNKQKRKARHIEAGYEKRGVPEDEAERRAWATVNKESGGGNGRAAVRKTGTRKTAIGKSKGKKSATRKTPGRAASTRKTAPRA